MLRQQLQVHVTRAFLLLAFLFATRGDAQQAVHTDAQPQDALIVLQLGACEAQCPVYKLVIFSDATTLFEGRHYVLKAGAVRGKTTRESLGKLLADANALRFFDLNNRYAPGGTAGGTCTAPKLDASTAILTISANGRTKTVVHFRGCAGADAERLTQFENRIVTAANISKLIR